MLPPRDRRRFGGLRGLHPRIALYWLVMRGAATLRRVRDGPDLRTPPRAAKTPRSSWRGRVKSDRRVVIRPSGLLVGALLVLAAVICVAVVGYGVVTLSPFWSICAGLAGAAVLAVTLRGFPLLGVIPVFLAAVLWGLATRPWLPEDFLGVFKFIGGNLAFDVPLVGAYLAAIATDSRRLSRIAVDEAVSGRRWWVEGTDRPSGPPPLREMEAIPATRFFVLDQGPCSHLVVAGRQVALLMSATWKPGAITMTPDGQVLRSGQPYAQGTDDIDALAAEVQLWLERLDGTGARIRGFLVVAPTG